MVFQPCFALSTEQNARYKPQNEDSAGVGLVVNAAGVRCLVGAVADGVSGLAMGREASRLAVRGFFAAVAAGTWQDAAGLAGEAPALVAKINNPIRNLSEDGAGTTFTAAVVVNDELVVIHIGDSSCTFVVRGADGSFGAQPLTVADTLVAEATSAGASEEETDAIHQHALAQCLGDASPSPQVYLNPRGISARNGWLVLCSDGVTDVLGRADMLAHAAACGGDLDKFCSTICRDSLVAPTRRGKPNRDNITVAVLAASRLSDATRESQSYAGGAADAAEAPAAAPVADFNLTGLLKSRRGLQIVLGVGLACSLGMIGTGVWLMRRKDAPVVRRATVPQVSIGVKSLGPGGAQPDDSTKITISVPTSPAPLVQTESTASDGDFLHIEVKEGDTLKSLARTWKCTVQEIVDLNNIPDRDVIKAGRKLKFPKPPMP